MIKLQCLIILLIKLYRRISSIVIPGILGGNVVQGAVNAKFAGGALFSKPWFQNY